MHDAHAQIVDELLAEQLLAVPDRVEHLPDGERRDRVPADDAQVGLELGRDRVLQPEKPVRLQ
jgi:hypothetical protein